MYIQETIEYFSVGKINLISLIFMNYRDLLRALGSHKRVQAVQGDVFSQEIVKFSVVDEKDLKKKFIKKLLLANYLPKCIFDAMNSA